MKFIELTDITNKEPVFINPHYLVMLHPYPNGYKEYTDPHTLIEKHDGNYIRVAETPATINNKLPSE